MFKQRLLTSLILIPLVLFAIYYTNSFILRIIIGLLTLLAGWEWLKLIPITNNLGKIFYLLALITITWLLSFEFEIILKANLILWLFIFIAVITFPSSQRLWGYPIIVALLSFIILPLFNNTVDKLYKIPQGPDFLIYLLCLVWAADVGAYLIGRHFGSHKLIPKVSPGKTIEGALAGLGLTMIVAFIGFHYFTIEKKTSWFFLAAITALISILGDLFISILKRRRNLKDTGHFFPGHGGILDRLDSLLAAAPVFYTGLSYHLYSFSS